MTRTLCYLRIGFTAFCGLLCLALVVLCVRSYWWYDHLMVQVSLPEIEFVSDDGRLLYICFDGDFET